MSKELLEAEINRVSYLLIKPEFPDWQTICHNTGTKICDKCQQIECDEAKGGVTHPRDHKWIIIKKSDRNEPLLIGPAAAFYLGMGWVCLVNMIFNLACNVELNIAVLITAILIALICVLYNRRKEK